LPDANNKNWPIKNDSLRVKLVWLAG